MENGGGGTSHGQTRGTWREEDKVLPHNQNYCTLASDTSSQQVILAR